MGRVTLLPAVVIALIVTACAPVSTPTPDLSPQKGLAPTAGPAPVKQKLLLIKTSFDKVPGWHGDRHFDAIAPLLRSCGRLVKRRDNQAIGKGQVALAGTVGLWRPVCAAAAKVSHADPALARRFFEKWFDPYLATANGRAKGLFTGYFEMDLRGSWIKTAKYSTPIYQRPPDMIEADLGAFRADLKGRHLYGKRQNSRFVPYDSRADIDAGSLAGRKLEILWVDNAADAFFLHVQGSGRVAMEDGRIVRVGFAGRNGRPYRSIGAELIRRGELSRDRVSMRSIRAWLIAHPDQAVGLMAANPSYIFFRVIAGALKPLAADQGPVGAAGLPLTPGRSLAVDRRFIPLGLPVWLDTTDPLSPSEPLRRIVITQDTGSAIKGPVRGDLFWGFGQKAATRAGLMKQSGRYFLLLPKR